MTFAAWYSVHVEPTLPPTLPDLARKAARDAMAACWNAALRSVCTAQFTREEFPPPCALPAEIREQIMELSA